MTYKQTCSFLKILIFATTVLIVGCPAPNIYIDLDPVQAEKSWNLFINKSEIASQEEITFNASLTFKYNTPENSGYRLSAYLWSNITPNNIHPVRADLQGMLGSTVAKIREDNHYFVIYDLKENTGYITTDVSKAMFSLGIPMPFTLGNLSLALTGRYVDFLGINGEKPAPKLKNTTINNESIFSIAQQDGTVINLILDQYGRPVLWQSNDSYGMKIEFLYNSNNEANAPEQININMNKDYSCSITIKSLKKLNTPFTPEQLDLIIPEGTVIKVL